MITDDVAYVLHARPFRETSQLVTLFSSASGRFNAVSRASRQSRSGNLLRPFVPLRIRWRGKSDLKSLSDVELLRPALSLSGSRLYVGLYLNELLIRLLHEHESHSHLFERYAKTLEILAEASEIEPVLRLFELALLDDLGYGLQLDVDMESGASVEPDQRYVFYPGEGVVLHRPGNKGLAIFSGEHLLAICRWEFADVGVLRSAKQLTRLALEPYLGNKPLHSRELFQGIAAGRVKSSAP
ncbi:MAG: hypothetical protein VR73_00955 [Gammaproteobacteria bacterium BRH_c0]|nr:MAG: hypothetical protein VR73_00955 [Gammaproteobacteria bacterium BRH_c0]